MRGEVNFGLARRLTIDELRAAALLTAPAARLLYQTHLGRWNLVINSVLLEQLDEESVAQFIQAGFLRTADQGYLIGTVELHRFLQSPSLSNNVSGWNEEVKENLLITKVAAQMF